MHKSSKSFDYIVGAMYQVLLGTLAQKGYAIKELHFDSNTATLRAQNADLVISPQKEDFKFSYIIEVKTSNCAKVQEFVLDGTGNPQAYDHVMATLLKEYPPTGLDILTSFVNLAFRSNLKLEVTYKKDGTIVDVRSNGELRTFTIVNPDSTTGAQITMHNKSTSVYVTTTAEMLTWVMSQERRYI